MVCYVFRMPFDQQDSIGFLTNRAARLLAQLLQARIAPLGIAPAQFSVLLALAREDGQTQRALADSLDVEQATMAYTLRRMQRDGLIRNTPHESDARAERIWLTAKARRALEPATEAAVAVNADALSGLSARERRTLDELLRRVIDTCRTQRAPRGRTRVRT